MGTADAPGISATGIAALRQVARRLGAALLRLLSTFVVLSGLWIGPAAAEGNFEFSDPFRSDIDQQRRQLLHIYYSTPTLIDQAQQRTNFVLDRMRAAGIGIPVPVTVDRDLILSADRAAGFARGSTDGNVVRLNPMVALEVDEDGNSRARQDSGLLIELTLIHELRHVAQLQRLGPLPNIAYPGQFPRSRIERMVREQEAYQAQLDHTPLSSAPRAVLDDYRGEFAYREQLWRDDIESTGQRLLFSNPRVTISGWGRRSDPRVTIYGQGREDIPLRRDAHIPEFAPVLIFPLPLDFSRDDDRRLADFAGGSSDNELRDAIRRAERTAFVIDPGPRFQGGATEFHVGVRGRGRSGTIVLVALYRDHLDEWRRAEVEVHVVGEEDPRDPPDDDDFDRTVLQLPAATEDGGGGGETALQLPEAQGYAQALIEAATGLAETQLALPAPPEDAFILPAPDDAAAAAADAREGRWQQLLGQAEARLGPLAATELADLGRLLRLQQELEKQAMTAAYATFFRQLPAPTQEALIAAEDFYKTYSSDFAELREMFQTYRYISSIARAYYDKGAVGLLEAGLQIGCHSLMQGTTKLAKGALGAEFGAAGYYITEAVGSKLEAVICGLFLPALFQEGVGESWLTGEVVYAADPEVNKWIKIFYTGEVMAGVDEPELPPGIDFFYRERVNNPYQIYRKFRSQPRLHAALRDHWRFLYNEYPELQPYLDLDSSELARRIWQRIYRVAGETLVAALREEMAKQPKPPPPHSAPLEFFRISGIRWPPPAGARPAPRVVSAEAEDLGEFDLGSEVTAAARIGVLGLAGIDERLTFDWHVEGAGFGTSAPEHETTVTVTFPPDRIDPLRDLFKVAESRFSFSLAKDLFEAGESYEVVARVRDTNEVLRFPFRTSEESETERVAACNSAVGAGSDEPETIRVEMGGFTGRASFAWEMYTVKDRMRLNSGGRLLHDTGCVSGRDRVILDILTGSEQLTVEVEPNCEGTTGTQWNFEFACPAEMEDGEESENAATPGSGRATAEVEPNDQPGEATAIVIGATVDGTILPRGDADFYALDLQRQGELKVRFPNVPPEIDIAFRVLHADGRQVWGWQTAEAEGEPFEAWADIKEPGSYVIEVRDGHNSASSPNPYAMMPLFTPTADTGEPNNDKDTATSLAWDLEVAANILPQGDVDHYSVRLDRQGQLTVAFPEAPSELDMAFRVLDAAGGQVWGWQSAEAEGKPFEAWADIKQPGTYVIEVRDGHNNARSPIPYRLIARLSETADPAEPNDSLEAATPLGWDAPIRANILPRGDADFYALDVERQGELQVSFSSVPAELDMAFRVLEAAGPQVWGWQTAAAEGEPFEAWADIKEPGSYVIEVRDGHNSARSPEPYTMVARIIPTADQGEPNDTVETATALAAGVALQANILPKGDADFYRLSLARGGRIRVQFTDSPPDLDMAFRVLNAAGGQVWGWQTAEAVGAPFEAWADIKEPGTYVIEVRDGHNNARSSAPYTVRLFAD